LNEPSALRNTVFQEFSPAADAVGHDRVRYFRVQTGRRRAGYSVRQISQTVPSQPRAVQCSRP
jgi:hypothetical protein